MCDWSRLTAHELQTVLSTFAVDEVWGVGARWGRKLLVLGIDKRQLYLRKISD